MLEEPKGDNVLKPIPLTWRPIKLSLWGRLGLMDWVRLRIKDSFCCGEQMAIGKENVFHTADHFDMLCWICHRVETILYTDK